jgi:thiamine pyrophosphate-dependent acetolactate synthase large subunit-like protein
VEAREIGRQLPVDLGVVADPNLLLESLVQMMKEQSIDPHPAAERHRWIRELQGLRTTSVRDFFDKASDGTPLKPQTITKEIVEVTAGSDAILAIGQGNSTASSIRIPVHRPGRFLQSVGLGAMGYAFPAALGAKLASPSRPVFCLVGDGDFGMVMQDLDTAAREQLNIVIVIYNNGGYGVNKLGQLARKRRPFGVDFINPDYAALAKMYGLNGFKINTRQELRSALRVAMASEVASVIDVMVDPMERVGQNPKAVGLYT